MRKKLVYLVLSCIFLSGCATYRVQKGSSPYDKGYVVSRYDKVVPEYTIGANNSVPDKEVAQERFKRRRVKVEYYYKQMGLMENRFKSMFIDPPVFLFQAVIGVFRMPAIAIKDYKYNHDPKYREKVDLTDDVEYKAQKERIKSIKSELNNYIQEDLKREPQSVSEIVSKEEAVAAPTQVSTTIKGPEPSASQQVPAVQQTNAPVEEGKVEEKLAEKPKPEVAPEVNPPAEVSALPVAVIIAKPTKGQSPLNVQFNAAKSYSPKGKIVSYVWDFGDGDISEKKNPTNTYYSATYGSRIFNVTLTVKDDKGQIGTTSLAVEVTNK